MKTILTLTLLTASSVLMTSCATNMPAQQTPGTVIKTQPTPAARVIHDLRKPHKYTSPVGNKVIPQPASIPYPYTAPNEGNDRMENYDDTTLPSAMSSPSTHSIFSE